MPAERLTPNAPFTLVGVDTFGPWNVTARNTRVGLVVLFTYLTTRYVHIEVTEEMRISSLKFINSLRLFYEIQ
jgi:hypothetical protein